MATLSATENWREFRWNTTPDTEALTSIAAIAGETTVRASVWLPTPIPFRHEADRDIAAGRLSKFKSMKELLKNLQR